MARKRRKKHQFVNEGVTDGKICSMAGRGRPPEIDLCSLELNEVMFVWPYSKKMWRKIQNYTYALRKRLGFEFVFKQDTKVIDDATIHGIRVQRVR